tara:strand:- start:10 stop:531 length:522 start_codon:yes stop_codon:yes gene_type:complete
MADKLMINEMDKYSIQVLLKALSKLAKLPENQITPDVGVVPVQGTITLDFCGRVERAQPYTYEKSAVDWEDQALNALKKVIRLEETLNLLRKDGRVAELLEDLENSDEATRLENAANWEALAQHEELIQQNTKTINSRGRLMVYGLDVSVVPKKDTSEKSGGFLGLIGLSREA